MSDLPPNHHADYRQFGGPFGYLAGLVMAVGRSSDARLVAELVALESSDKVLDIGCGPGTAVRLAGRLGARATGLDPAPPMLRLARLFSSFRQPIGEVAWIEGTAEDIPLPDDAVSVCWSLATVHHWRDLDAGLAEVQRVLGPGGRFVALEKRTKLGATGNAGHGWTADQARHFAAMLSERGFADVDVINRDLGWRKVVAVKGVASG